MDALPYLILGGVVLTAGDLVAGGWVSGKGKKFYLLAIALYMVGMALLVQSYRFNDIAVASISMEILNIIILTISGVYLFRETITKYEFAGIVLGILAIIIMDL
jgi:glucose uptake protein GlcU